MQIFIVAMPGCANLGDDLISSYLVELLFQKYSVTKIGILCGQNISYSYYKQYIDKIIFFEQKSKKDIISYFKLRTEINNYINNCDLIIIGGGGLIQDSHSPFTIYKYLRYNNLFSKPTLLLGIGVGPVNYKFNKWYLRKVLKINQLIQVRDEESRILLQNIGVKSSIIVDKDIIEGSKNLVDFDFEKKINNENEILGCNIRNWKDVDIDKFVLFLQKIIIRHKIERIKFFVFENGFNNTSEKQFSEKIITKLVNIINKPVELYVYNETNTENFFTEFFSVTIGIASRYHANILWQLANIKVLPIVYSPKVKSLYTKYGYEAKTFNDLILSSSGNSEFIKINLNDSNYSLPTYAKNNEKNSLSINIINFSLFIISFIYELFVSIFIRFKFLFK